ncbi:MAG TPA: hypothetical protein VLF59_03865 [Candidatus Saccharimonadales bacterium]|nr:hypothetical protein [Candidatus Saccharimonadales bacterium]
MKRLKRLWGSLMPHHLVYIQTFFLLSCCFVIFTAPATVVIRFQNRSLLVNKSEPGATAQYKVSLTYTTQTTIGSLDMQFCIDPIPINPCVVPPGLDLSNAVLSDQTGETGYTMNLVGPNHIILSRTPGVVGQTPSTYTFDNIVNPTYTIHSYSIRLADYASTDATGTIIDLGSVVTQVNDSITLETQVPPILVFCVAQQIDALCNQPIGGNYSDLGELDPTKTLTAMSQMGAGTNASGGYSITVHGTTMAAGTHVIDNLTAPTISAQGNNQFGINLVANTAPDIGQDPDGAFVNALPTPEYSIPNKFLYRDGDEVASAPNVSLVRRFTVSYIVNSSPNLRAGVYTTTLTFLCTGRF